MFSEGIDGVFVNLGHRVIHISIPHSWRGGGGVQSSALKLFHVEIGHFLVIEAHFIPHFFKKKNYSSKRRYKVITIHWLSSA